MGFSSIVDPGNLVEAAGLRKPFARSGFKCEERRLGAAENTCLR